MFASVRETSEQILAHSRKRWLSPTEIFVLLSHEPHETGLGLQINPILNPKDGQLHIFEEQVFAQHKSTIDNIDWAKKKGQNKKLQETYIKLKIEGKEVISGVYSKAAENDNFRRRSYRLLDKNISKYCIVHYRLSNDDDRHDQHSVPQSVLHHASKYLPPGTIQMPLESKERDQLLVKVEQQEEEQDLDWVLDLMTADPFGNDGPKVPAFNEHVFSVPSLSPNSAIAFPPPSLQKIKSIAVPSKLPAEQVTIVDFSPTNVSTVAVQRKLLICLSAPIADCALKIGFTSAMGYQIVSGTLLPGGNVIRCSIPGLASGKWILTVLNENLELATCADELDIIEPVLSPGFDFLISRVFDLICLAANILGKRMHSSNPAMSRSVGFGSSVRFDVTGSVNEGYDRQYKIRLVERLTTVRTVMNPSENSNSSFMKVASVTNSVNMEGSSMREAAERAEIGNYELLNISDQELKSVVEEQIVKLVQDLIKRASLNAEIRNEIDSLDSTGFNLLHYCCIYNQVALIPILLLRGTKINRKTVGGSTSLHLAASAGHFAIVKLLVEHKADVEELDENGNTAGKLASMHGHSDIAAYLESHAINQVSNSLSRMSTSISSNIDAFKIFEETVTSLTLLEKCALLQTDAKTLLSDIDREYLGHAMSMMRPSEVQAVHDEVKNIEKSDIGAWLVSKHNVFLKEVVNDVAQKQLGAINK